MTMNTKPKMTAEQRLQRAMERNEVELQKAEEKRSRQLPNNRYSYPYDHAAGTRSLPPFDWRIDNEQDNH